MQDKFKLDETVKSVRLIMYDKGMIIPENSVGQIVHPPRESQMRSGYVWVMWDGQTISAYTSCECLSHK